MGKKKITRVILGTRNNLQVNDRTIFWLLKRYPGKVPKPWSDHFSQNRSRLNFRESVGFQMNKEGTFSTIKIFASVISITSLIPDVDPVYVSLHNTGFAPACSFWHPLKALEQKKQHGKFTLHSSCNVSSVRISKVTRLQTRPYIFKALWLGRDGTWGIVICSLPEGQSQALEYILGSLLCLRRTLAAGKTFIFVLCSIIAWMSVEFSLNCCLQPFLVWWLLDFIEEKPSYNPPLFGISRQNLKVKYLLFG